MEVDIENLDAADLKKYLGAADPHQLCGCEPTTTTSSMPLTIFQCPDKIGSFPHPDNCMKFYECDHWTFYEKTCSKGTLWDDGCKYPYQVNCSDRKIPTENQIISSPKRQTGFFLVRY